MPDQEEKTMRIELIRLELDLYRRSYEIEQEIHAALKELWEDVGPGVTHYDYELGRMSMSSPSAEQQALQILYREEGLKAKLNSLNKRVERLKQAISQLDYKSRRILTATILNGVKIGYNLEEVEKALLCLYEKWSRDREKRIDQRIKERKRETVEKARLLLS